MQRESTENSNGPFQKVTEYWAIHFLNLEFLLALLVTTGFGYWCKVAHGEKQLLKLIGTQHSAIYGTFVTLDGALLGFMIAATAIILGFAPGPQFKILRGSDHYPMMWRTLKSTIRVLGVATITAILALLIDRDGNSNLFMLIAWTGTTLLAGFRVCRSLWILEKTIDILTVSKKE